jgi:hypothetical protein
MRVENTSHSKQRSSQIARKFRRAKRNVAKAESGCLGLSGKGGTKSCIGCPARAARGALSHRDRRGDRRLDVG